MNSTDEFACFRLTPPEEGKGSSALIPVLMGPIGLVGAIAALGLAATGRGSGFAIFLGGLSAAILWYVIALLVIVRGGRRGWIRLQAHSGGFTLVASQASPVGGLGGALILVGSATWLGIHALASADGHDLRWFIGLGSIALFAVGGLALAGRSAVRPGTIGLTPSGLELGAGRVSNPAWDDVRAVGFDRRGMAFSLPGGAVHFRPGDLRSDPYLVAELIEYYRAHPEDRDELADHRALQRIRFHH